MWQLRDGEPNGHDDPKYDSEVIERLDDLHARARPIVGGFGDLFERMAPYVVRLDGVLGDGSHLIQPDHASLSDTDEALRNRLQQAVQRRLERSREPRVFHPIRAMAEIKTEYPEREDDIELPTPDVTRRVQRRQSFDRDMHKRIAKKLGLGGLPPETSPGEGPRITGKPDASTMPLGMATGRGNLRPNAFPGRPQPTSTSPPPEAGPKATANAPEPEKITPIRAGDSLAARARAKVKARKKSQETDGA